MANTNEDNLAVMLEALRLVILSLVASTPVDLRRLGESLRTVADHGARNDDAKRMLHDLSSGVIAMANAADGKDEGAARH